MFGNLFCDLYAFLDIRTVPAIVPHIGLNDYCHIFSSVLHHFVQHFIKEANTILKAASVLVMTMVRARTDKL